MRLSDSRSLDGIGDGWCGCGGWIGDWSYWWGDRLRWGSGVSEGVGNSGWGRVVDFVDGGAHIINNRGAVGVIVAVNHRIEIVGVGWLKNILSIAIFGEETFTNISISFDGATFGVHDVGQEGEAVASFFPADVASAWAFYFFGGGNLNRMLALTGEPDTATRFEIVRSYSSKVSFHWLVLFKREGESAKEKNDG